MKTYKSRLMSIIVAGSLLLGACSGSSTDETTTTDSVNAKMDSDATSMVTPAVVDSNKINQDFINYAVPKNAAEIAWLMAAKLTGTSKELKAHADMMLKDHKKLEVTVKSYLAKHTNITAPVADTTGVVNLTEPKGEAWDKAFTQKMITEHEEILAKLNEAESNLTDADLKKIATDTKPVVQSHLDMVKAMQATMK